MRKITLEEFQTQCMAQHGNRDRVNMAFTCPVCKTVQSARSFIDAGVAATFEEVEKYVGFACIGRFTKAGQHKKDTPPGKGCNWSLGGLFKLHELVILETKEDKTVVEHPHFEIAAPEQAQALKASYDGKGL